MKSAGRSAVLAALVGAWVRRRARPAAAGRDRAAAARRIVTPLVPDRLPREVDGDAADPAAAGPRHRVALPVTGDGQSGGPDICAVLDERLGRGELVRAVRDGQDRPAGRSVAVVRGRLHLDIDGRVASGLDGLAGHHRCLGHGPLLCGAGARRRAAPLDRRQASASREQCDDGLVARPMLQRGHRQSLRGHHRGAGADGHPVLGRLLDGVPAGSHCAHRNAPLRSGPTRARGPLSVPPAPAGRIGRPVHRAGSRRCPFRQAAALAHASPRVPSWSNNREHRSRTERDLARPSGDHPLDGQECRRRTAAPHWLPSASRRWTAAGSVLVRPWLR